ncbi:TPA: DUF3265 domain-containing protein [Vibrio vulnificus]|nr:DUF3265 domain-containing protein [Vibrio vulnificus]
MHAAWHFWYAVSFGGEGGLRKVGLGGIHPLTQRYTFKRNYGITCRRACRRMAQPTRLLYDTWH